MKKNYRSRIAGALLCGLVQFFPATAGVYFNEPQDPQSSDAGAWAALSKPTVGWGSIDVKYPRSVPSETGAAPALFAWRGERVSAQAVLSTPVDLGDVSVVASDLKSGKNIISASNIRTWFVAYTLAGEAGEGKPAYLVPDRLDDAVSVAVAANTTRPVWIEVKVPADAKPGVYKGSITVICDGGSTRLPYKLEVCNRVLPEPSEWAFHLDLWQNPYAVARYFDVPLWSREHFDAMRPLMEMYAEAGGKVVTASIIQHPWNGQTYDPFESMIAKMKCLDGSWKYDYTVFDKWVEFAMSCGVNRQIDCYTLVPWQYKFDYYDCATNSVRLVDCKPQEQAYRDLILPFLKDFAAHLKTKGWFGITCIAMDERPMEQMEAAYAIVKEADPGYRIAGAANYNPDSDAADKIFDMSVIYHYDLLTPEAAARRKAAGQFLTFYTCCSPKHPNTFTLSDYAESAFIGWHAAAVGYDGYLRWAWNSWPEDPCIDSRFGNWTSGDTYIVYPEGPSVRYERLVEGIQDYEKIRILRQSGADMSAMDEALKEFAPSIYDESLSAGDILCRGKKSLRSVSK